jgi:hypothetical protein
MRNHKEHKVSKKNTKKNVLICKCANGLLPLQLCPFAALREIPTKSSLAGAFNFQLSTFNLQLSTFNLQLSTFNLQPSTFNFQPSTFNLQL